MTVREKKLSVRDDDYCTIPYRTYVRAKRFRCQFIGAEIFFYLKIQNHNYSTSTSTSSSTELDSKLGTV